METTDVITKVEVAEEVKKTKRRTVKAIKKFPSHSIEESLKIPILIKENNGGNPWETEQLAKALNLKKGGNHFYYLTASSRDYGFTIGTRETHNVELNDLGRKYAYAQSQEDLLNAVWSAFNNIELFKKVYEYYKGNEPSDETFFRNALVSTFGVDESLHDDFLKVYHENRRFLETFVGEQTVQPMISTLTNSQTANSSSHPIVEKKIFVIMPFSEKAGTTQKDFLMKY